MILKIINITKLIKTITKMKISAIPSAAKYGTGNCWFGWASGT